MRSIKFVDCFFYQHIFSNGICMFSMSEHHFWQFCRYSRQSCRCVLFLIAFFDFWTLFLSVSSIRAIFLGRGFLSPDAQEYAEFNEIVAFFNIWDLFWHFSRESLFCRADSLPHRLGRTQACKIRAILDFWALLLWVSPISSFFLWRCIS
jgi:hypothetical protein